MKPQSSADWHVPAAWPEAGESPQQTDCCIVGGGPAGAVLALLLARQCVAVTLLEAHHDFNRPFRGNTLNPAILHLMAELGLIEGLLRLPHAKVLHFTIQTAAGPLIFADFQRLNTPYPFVMMLPQDHFLEFIINEARRYPHFRLIMGARVEALIEVDSMIQGVRFRADDTWHAIHAQLTIGADGRFSRTRRLASLEPIAASPPMDVFWFNLPRRAHDPDHAGALFRFGPRSLVVFMDHFDHWQVGYLLEKGSFSQVRAAGLPALRQAIARLAPEFADRVDHLQDWRQGTLLSVESDFVRKWFRPGLLLIGDAAHVMSPVGGVGINCAIQDAIEAANILAVPLKTRTLRVDHLKRVQQRRAWPTRLVQTVQGLAHRRVVAQALRSRNPYRVPWLLRLLLRVPLVRTIPANLIAFTGGIVRLECRSRSFL